MPAPTTINVANNPNSNSNADLRIPPTDPTTNVLKHSKLLIEEPLYVPGGASQQKAGILMLDMCPSPFLSFSLSLYLSPFLQPIASFHESVQGPKRMVTQSESQKSEYSDVCCVQSAWHRAKPR